MLLFATWDEVLVERVGWVKKLVEIPWDSLSGRLALPAGFSYNFA
jgi:hypothetical protein